MEYKYKAPRQIDGFFHDQQKVRWGYVRRRQTELFGEVRKKNRLQTKDILTSDDGAQLVVEPLKKKLGFFERIKGYLPCLDEEGNTGYLQVVERSVVRVALVLLVVLLALATSFYLLFQAARPADDTPIRIASGEMYNPNPENIRLPGITEVHAQAGSTRVSQLLLNVEGNAYNLTYTITLNETGEELYVSQPIPPGYGVREFDMERTLEAGSYPITIHVASSALESDESESSAAYNAGELAATLIVR